jgi:arginine/lysine/ornithine decarboxylase
MDSAEGFARLARALHEVDESLAGTAPKPLPTPRDIYRAPQKKMEIHEAEEAAHATVPLSAAVGQISASYICLYPPGVPIVVPGEELDAQTVATITECIELGLEVEGLAADSVDGVYTVTSH